MVASEESGEEHIATLSADFIGWGSSFGHDHRTQIAMTFTGEESRQRRWANARRKYEVASRLQTKDAMFDLVNFITARQGAAHSFLLIDLLDSTTATDHISAHANDDVFLGTGDGTTSAANLIWQMCKRYDVDTPYELTRTLRKTITILVAVGGVAQTIGTDFTFDPTTGIITFETGSAPAIGAGITAGCLFFVPVRFDVELDQWLENAQESFENGSISAPMIEEKDPTPSPDRNVWDVRAAGAHAVTSGTDMIEFRGGDFHILSAGATAPMDIRLPIIGDTAFTDYSTVIPPQSGPVLVVLNNNATHTHTFKEYSGGAWVSLPLNPTIAPLIAVRLYARGRRWLVG